MEKGYPNITVGQLKLHLESYDDDMELYFGGLDFYRLKQRGTNLVQGKRHPEAVLTLTALLRRAAG